MDLTGARWRKSSFSGDDGNGDGCIEVALLPDGTVALRDTKNRALAPHHYSPAAWSAFVTALRHNTLTP